MKKTRLQELFDEYAFWYHQEKNNQASGNRQEEPTFKEWFTMKVDQTENASSLVLPPEEQNVINRLK